MKRRILCLLLAVVMVMAVTCSAWAEGSIADIFHLDEIKAEAQVRGGIVTLKITAIKNTYNGKITVGYDDKVLEYKGAESDATVFTAEEEDGTVTMGYAVSTADTMKFRDTIAELTFAIKGKASFTKFEITLEDFNDEPHELEEHEMPDLWVDLDGSSLGGGSGSGSGSGSGNGSGSDSGSDLDKYIDMLPSISFDDVSTGSWFYDAVEYVVGMGYFKGISDTSFGPYDSMNRAMFVTVLGRMAGVNADSYKNTQFTDVVSGSYYEGYVVWAAQNGIVKGTSDTTFSPNEPVTREQMAVFLYRYAQYLGMDVSSKGADLSSFADASSVSSWALDAVKWAVANGIINGTDKGLEPAATANRAQVAQIIYRFDSLAK